MGINAQGRKRYHRHQRISRQIHSDPIVTMNGKNGGQILVDEIKAQRELVAYLPDFDFDARFNILHFDMIMATTHPDRDKNLNFSTLTNMGAAFEAPAQQLIAKPDRAWFTTSITST